MHPLVKHHSAANSKRLTDTEGSNLLGVFINERQLVKISRKHRAVVASFSPESDLRTAVKTGEQGRSV